MFCFCFFKWEYLLEFSLLFLPPLWFHPFLFVVNTECWKHCNTLCTVLMHLLRIRQGSVWCQEIFYSATRVQWSEVLWCAVCSLQCAACSVQCAVCSAIMEVLRIVPSKLARRALTCICPTLSSSQSLSFSSSTFARNWFVQIAKCIFQINKCIFFSIQNIIIEACTGGL